MNETTKKKPGRKKKGDGSRTKSLTLRLSAQNEAELRKLLEIDGRPLGKLVEMLEGYVNANLEGGQIFRLWQAERVKAEQAIGAQLGIEGVGRPELLEVAGTIRPQSLIRGEGVAGGEGEEIDAEYVEAEG